MTSNGAADADARPAPCFINRHRSRAGGCGRWAAKAPPLRHYARSTLHWKQLNLERM
jgi:hypothetical protein